MGGFMQSNSPSQPVSLVLPLGDFGQLQARYQSLGLAERAATVLKDAEPALQAAEEKLKKLSSDHAIRQVFAKLRKNSVLADRMRPSEAKNLLMDSSSDYIECTMHKLAAWKKTMERVSNGESIAKDKNGEFIPGDAPLALAIAGTRSIGNYLSITQLALMEQAKGDPQKTSHLKSLAAEVRRLATVLSDCEVASGISTSVH
jgi:hypothetical protein